jgi:hypothetical protein
MPRKRTSDNTVSRRVLGQPAERRKSLFRAGLYARVSIHDQQTLQLQRRGGAIMFAGEAGPLPSRSKRSARGASVRESGRS